MEGEISSNCAPLPCCPDFVSVRVITRSHNPPRDPKPLPGGGFEAFAGSREQSRDLSDPRYPREAWAMGCGASKSADPGVAPAEKEEKRPKKKEDKERIRMPNRPIT